MLHENDLQFFRDNGYLIVRDLFSKATVLAARQRLEALFDAAIYQNAPNSSPHNINDLYRFAPDLLPLIFTEPYMQVMRDLLGPQAVWIPECAVHRERFFGWHKDSGGVERAGMLSHKTYAHPMLTAAIYFQDNGVGGGGLTVVSGTHRAPDHTLNYYGKSLPNRLKIKCLKWLGISEFDRLERNPGKIDLPSQLGDLVIFDIRLSHRATLPQQKSPTEKLAIFNAFVRDDEVGREFLAFQKLRPEPYYQFFRQSGSPECVFQWGEHLGMKVLY